MALTVTASAETSPAGVPRVRVAITGASGASAEVSRVDETTPSTAPVRQGSPAALVGGAATIYDYEAVFGDWVHYTVTDGASATATSGSVYQSAAGPWLVHPGQPEKSVPLSVTRWPAWTRPIQRGVYQPMSRPNRVVVSAMRQSREGELVAYTVTAQQRDTLAAVLADGSALLIKGTGAEGAGTYWVSVGDVDYEPAGSDLRGYTVWTLPLIEVDSPPGRALPPVSYGLATATFDSYAHAQAIAPTYADRIGGAWAH
jgi:hypothetical protein